MGFLDPKPLSKAAADAAYAGKNVEASISAKVDKRRAAAIGVPSVAKALPPVKAADIPTLAWSYADGGAATPLAGTINTLPHNTSNVLFYGMTPKDTEYSAPKWDRSNTVNAGKASMFGVHFDTDALDMTVAFRTNQTDFKYWVWIDDEPLTADPVSYQAVVGSAAVAGATYRLRLTFAGTKQRRIKVYVTNVSFRFLEHPVTALVTPAPRPAQSIVCGFDSLTNGALGLSDMETWGFRTALMLGMEYYSVGSGGRGYAVVDGGGFAKHSDQIVIDSIAAVKPDYCYFVGSVNDGGVGVDTAAAYVFSQLATLSPTTQILVAGPQQTNVAGLTGSTRLASRNQLRTAAVAAPNVIAFFDILGTDANTVTTWAAGYRFSVGNTMVYKGGVYRCTRDHNDGATPDWTAWNQIGFMTGTGYSAGLTGDGTRDLMLGSDNVHWTSQGHKAAARQFTEQAIRALSATGFVDTYQLSTVRPTGQDLQPPAPVTLSLGTTTATSAVLNWTAADGATNYRIERSTASNGVDYGGWSTVTSRTPPTQTLTVTGLVAGYGYRHRIVAVNAIGDGAPSNVVQYVAG